MNTNEGEILVRVIASIIIGGALYPTFRRIISRLNYLVQKDVNGFVLGFVEFIKKLLIKDIIFLLISGISLFYIFKMTQ